MEQSLDGSSVPTAACHAAIAKAKASIASAEKLMEVCADQTAIATAIEESSSDTAIAIMMCTARLMEELHAAVTMEQSLDGSSVPTAAASADTFHAAIAKAKASIACGERSMEVCADQTATTTATTATTANTASMAPGTPAVPVQSARKRKRMPILRVAGGTTGQQGALDPAVEVTEQAEEQAEEGEQEQPPAAGKKEGANPPLWAWKF